MGADLLHCAADQRQSPEEVSNPPRSFQEHKDLIDPGYSTYIELESVASKLITYQPLAVPGLLQTADYIRPMQQDVNGDTASAAEIDRQMAALCYHVADLTPARVGL